MQDTSSMDEPRRIRLPLLGFELELRTDFLALAAFLMALVSALYQLSGYLRGDQVTLHPPPQVTITFSDYGGGQRYLRLGARMAYSNSGHVGYNAVLAEERVHFSFDEVQYLQYWQAFQTFDSIGDKLVPHFQSDAHPVPVMAGSAKSHETFFAAQPERCRKGQSCDPWVHLIRRGPFLKGIQNSSTLEFIFEASLVGGGELSVACEIDVTDDLRRNLVQKGWDAPRCWAN